MKLCKKISNGVCPFALLGITPYYLSFKQGAYFPWSKNKDEVDYHCPKKDGVAFLIRKIKEGKEIKIIAEVMKTGNFRCPYNHKKGDVVDII